MSIVVSSFDVSIDRRHCAFVSNICILAICVELKHPFVSLVDCVISQMHVQILEIIFARLAVLLSAESSHPFFVQIDAKRVDGLNEDIESAVEFEVINQKRVLDILLHNIVFFGLEVFNVLTQEYSSPLTSSFRLCYKHFLLAFRERSFAH